MNFLSLSSLGAIVFLIVVVVAPLAWLGWRCARSRLSVVQCLAWHLAYLIAKLLWRAKLPPRLPIAAGEGAVIISNHRSSVDPFFIQTATPRKVHYMVAREYCVHPAFGPFLRMCEVIPVGRGGVDTAATKLAIRLAAAGGLVGMFPEGRINMTEELMLPGRPGAALIALKARVNLLPCYIEGSPYNRTSWSPFFMPAEVTVRLGEPIDLSEFFGREQEAGVVQEVMNRGLKAVAALAGQTDYQPRIAGRSWKPTSEELEADMAAADVRRRERRS